MSKADSLRIPDYLSHIIEAIERIYRYIEDLDEVAFLQDEKTQDAVIRNFEIIGEAVRKQRLCRKSSTSALVFNVHLTQPRCSGLL